MTTQIQGVRLDEGERGAPPLPRDIQTEELMRRAALVRRRSQPS